MKFVVPYNPLSQTIYYNLRMIVCAPVDEGREPIVWRITKVESTQEYGLLNVTMAQDLFDSNRDYVGRDPVTNKVTDMIADYYSPTTKDMSALPEVDPRTLPDYSLTLKYAGIKPVVKVRGNFKKFTAIFNDKHGNEVPNVFVDEWKVELDGVDVTTLEDNPFAIVTSNEDDTLTANQIKVKTASDEMLGKVLTITATKDGLISSQNVEIVGM